VAGLVAAAVGAARADVGVSDIVILRGRIDPAMLRRLVLIRPGQGNPGMEIHDEEVRARVRELTRTFIGEGDPL
jgi:hypothetical protein